MAILDAFGGTNGDLLDTSADWVHDYDEGSGGTSDRVEYDSGGGVVLDQYGYDGSHATGFWLRAEASFPDDHYAEAVKGNNDAGFGPMVRGDSSGDGYGGLVGGGAIRAIRFDGGTMTTLAQTLPTTATSDVVTIDATGTTILVQRNNSATNEVSVTDATHSSGKPGLWTNGTSAGNGCLLDDFECSDATAAGTDHVESDVDAVGILDSADVAKDAGSSDVDDLGMSDEAVVALGQTSTDVDDLGLTDSAARSMTVDRSRTDGLGMSDSATVRLDNEDTDVDDLGLTDSVEIQRSSARSSSDDLGMSDEAVASISGAHSDVDDLGMSDAATRSLDGVRADTDSLGLSDTISSARQIVRVLTDSLGATDTATTSETAEGSRTDVDGMGLTDSVAAAKHIVVVLDDSIGIIDAVSIGLEEDSTDTLGISDDITVRLDKVVTSTDDLGAVDSAVTSLASSGDQSDVDDLGLSDSIVIRRTVVRTSTDDLGLSDSVVQDFSGAVFAPVEDRVVEADVDRILSAAVDEATLSTMRGRGMIAPIESASAEPVRVVLTTKTDPTGGDVDFNLTTGDRSSPGASWVAGTWASTWAARTGRVEANSPNVGTGASLDVVAGETYVLWIRYNSSTVKRAGQLEIL